MNNEEKLRNFENNCRVSARNKKNELESELNSKMQAAIQEEIEEYRKKQQNKKQKMLHKIEKNFNIDLWELEREYKQKYEDEKNRIKEILFEEIKADLISFTDTEEYIEYLKRNINRSVEQLKNKDNITIYLTLKDKEKMKDIEDRYNIQTMDYMYIGGCIAEDGEININNTLLENLKERIDEYKSSI